MAIDKTPEDYAAHRVQNIRRTLKPLLAIAVIAVTFVGVRAGINKISDWKASPSTTSAKNTSTSLPKKPYLDISTAFNVEAQDGTYVTGSNAEPITLKEGEGANLRLDIKNNGTDDIKNVSATFSEKISPSTIGLLKTGERDRSSFVFMTPAAGKYQINLTVTGEGVKTKKNVRLTSSVWVFATAPSTTTTTTTTTSAAIPSDTTTTSVKRPTTPPATVYVPSTTTTTTSVASIPTSNGTTFTGNVTSASPSMTFNISASKAGEVSAVVSLSQGDSISISINGGTFASTPNGFTIFQQIPAGGNIAVVVRRDSSDAAFALTVSAP